jgi:cation diffusion facilitator family transporter
MTQGSGTRAIIAAFLANLGIAVLKFIGFLITGAASMLAESIHSVADTGNQGLLILGGRRGRQQADEEHPFGYGRERYFWAFLVAVVLFTVGSLYALYEGVEKLRHPHELTNPPVAIAILLGAVVLESWSLRTAVREATPLRGDRSWWSFIRHTKSPELPVVLLEDLGALCGLVFALLGIGLAVLTGNARFDALGSVAIGLLLGVIAVVVGTEMRSLLIGEAATARDVAAIRQALEGTDGVRRLIHLRTMHLGPDELLVAGKLELDPSFTFAQVTETVNQAEARIRAAVDLTGLIYLEPDIYRERAGEPAAGGEPADRTAPGTAGTPKP